VQFDRALVQSTENRVNSELSLQDERDVSAVILRYADAMDRRDWVRFATCFAEDFSADYGVGAQWSSGAAITAAMEEVYRDLGEALHRITNIVITKTGTDVYARSYIDGLSMRKDGTVAIRAEGYYDDVLIRTHDGWKIRRRRFVAVRLQR
jgi:ketosteroid isomerase-like protein